MTPGEHAISTDRKSPMDLQPTACLPQWHHCQLSCQSACLYLCLVQHVFVKGTLSPDSIKKKNFINLHPGVPKEILSLSFPCVQQAAILCPLALPRAATQQGSLSVTTTDCQHCMPRIGLFMHSHKMATAYTLKGWFMRGLLSCHCHCLISQFIHKSLFSFISDIKLQPASTQLPIIFGVDFSNP